MPFVDGCAGVRGEPFASIGEGRSGGSYGPPTFRPPPSWVGGVCPRPPLLFPLSFHSPLLCSTAAAGVPFDKPNSTPKDCDAVAYDRRHQFCRDRGIAEEESKAVLKMRLPTRGALGRGRARDSQFESPAFGGNHNRVGDIHLALATGEGGGERAFPLVGSATKRDSGRFAVPAPGDRGCGYLRQDS